MLRDEGNGEICTYVWASNYDAVWIGVGKSPCSLKIRSRWNWPSSSRSGRFKTRTKPRSPMRCDPMWNPEPTWVRRRKKCSSICKERTCSYSTSNKSLYLPHCFGNNESTPESVWMWWRRKGSITYRESKPLHFTDKTVCPYKETLEFLSEVAFKVFTGFLRSVYS